MTTPVRHCLKANRAQSLLAASRRQSSQFKTTTSRTVGGASATQCPEGFAPYGKRKGVVRLQHTLAIARTPCSFERPQPFSGNCAGLPQQV